MCRLGRLRICILLHLQVINDADKYLDEFIFRLLVSIKGVEGDDASGEDTSCDVTLCPENYSVQGNACEPC